MEQMTRTEMTNRLGLDPSNWDFFGQVYTPPEGFSRTCSLLLEEAKICFTIKPKSGKGRMTVSDKAIKLFERFNPDLYVKLHTGLMFMMVHNKAVDASVREQEQLKQLRAAEKRYSTVKKAARQHIDRYRKTIKKGALPEYLRTMKDLLQRTSPYFSQDDTRALWMDQQAVELEKRLLDLEPIEVAPQPQVVLPSTPSPTEPLSTPLAFADIPEIDF